MCNYTKFNNFAMVINYFRHSEAARRNAWVFIYRRVSKQYINHSLAYSSTHKNKCKHTSYMHAREHVRMHTCTYAHTRVRTLARARAHTHTHVNTHTLTREYEAIVYTQLFIYYLG